MCVSEKAELPLLEVPVTREKVCMRTSECDRTYPCLFENIYFFFLILCEYVCLTCVCVRVCVCTCPCHSGCPDPAWLSQSEESSDCDQYQWTGCYSEWMEKEKNVKMFNIDDRVKDSEGSVQRMEDGEMTGELLLLEQL